MAVNPKTTVRKIVAFPRTLVAAIEDYRFQNRIRTESEAIRRLIELGLETARLPGGEHSLGKGEVG